MTAMELFSLDSPSPWRRWRDHALEYLPSEEVPSEFKDNLQFYALDKNDGCLLSREVCEKKEIILLSERILPGQFSREDDPEVRYFIYIVFHEVAHAFKKHTPSNLPSEEDPQEKEADELALKWFNSRQGIKPLTLKEVKETKEKNHLFVTNHYFNRRNWWSK